MASSLFTGVTGLRVNQQMLDVVGNNLANSNTTGYKAQRIRFSDLVYQTFSPATAATGTNGGTDPVQVGLGARVAAIDPDLQQGSLEATGRDLDMAIEGDGYFVGRNGTQSYFARAGAFGIDSQNYLVDPANGFRVQRFDGIGEGTATSPAFQTAGNTDINIPLGTGIPGRASTSVTVAGNLSANAVGPRAQTITSVQPYTSAGSPAIGSTLLNSLDDNLAPYAPGDQVTLQGATAANVPVNVTIPVDDTTTLDDILNAINTNFPGSTATLDAAGNIVVADTATGPSSLSLSINDVATNTGGMSWGSHNESVTTTGKAGDTLRNSIQVYDAQGTAHSVNMTFQKQANNIWDMTADINPAEGTVLDGSVTGITFNADGSFQQVTGTGVGNGSINLQFNGFSAPQTINLNFGTANGFDGVMQVGGPSSAVPTGQDGYAAGFLTSLSIGQDGVINGIFTNGQSLPIAQLAIAKFANAAALNRIGDNYYALSTESGPPLYGAGLAGGRGAVRQKALESSNVDVSLEFTRLIIAQRGFQVNAKVITASNEVLQDLANILR